MLCRVADDFVGNSRDQRKKHDTGKKLSCQRIEMRDGKNKNADDHYDEQKTRSTPRMQGRKLPRIGDIQVFAGFKVVYRFVLGAVILKHPVHVFHPRHHVQKDHKNENAENSVDAVEKDRTLKSDLGLHCARDKQRQGYEQENINAERKDEITADQPG